MRDFEDSTLWRVSAFERVRRDTGSSAYMLLQGTPSALPSTLVGDLQQLERSHADRDVLEVAAACLRHREAALLYLQHEGLVWPVTLFPAHQLYHAPRDLTQVAPDGLARLSLISIEPAGVRAPGHWMHERVGHEHHYRPLLPLLWTLALNGPRHVLLAEIGGTAAYRALHAAPPEGIVAPGALGPAIERLHLGSVPLKTIASWPGMSLERASRLLNALYLMSELMVSRVHAAARAEPQSRGLFGWRRR